MLDEWERRIWADVERGLGQLESGTGQHPDHARSRPCESGWLRYAAAVTVPLSLPALTLVALHPVASSTAAVLVATALCMQWRGTSSGPTAPRGHGDRTSTS